MLPKQPTAFISHVISESYGIGEHATKGNALPELARKVDREKAHSMHT